MSIPHGLDLNSLVALDALLAERSVTRAARSLGVTQSAVSHKLRALREAFADPLLVGGGQGTMVLTARAEEMREPLARALSDLRAAVTQEEPFDARSSARHFVISTADYGEFVFLPRALEHVADTAPNVTYEWVPPAADPVTELASSKIDLLIGPRMPDAAGLRQKKLLVDRFVVVTRRGHPRIGRKRLTLELYLELDHLLVAPGRSPGGIVDDLLAARGLRRRVAVRTSHFVAAPFLVARSDLLLTGPEALAREACHHAALSIFPPPLPVPATDIFMCWHERAQADLGHQWLRQMTRAVTRSSR